MCVILQIRPGRINIEYSYSVVHVQYANGFSVIFFFINVCEEEIPQGDQTFSRLSSRVLNLLEVEKFTEDLPKFFGWKRKDRTRID